MDLVSRAIVDRHGRRFAGGEVIYRTGDESREMFFVREGQVRILKQAGGQDVCLVVLGPGEFFGESSLWDARRAVTAVADGEALVVSVEAEIMLQMLTEHTELWRRILSRLGQRLRASDNRLLAVMVRDQPARVAACLCELAEEGIEGVDGRIEFKAGVDAALVAGQAGVLPSVVESLWQGLCKADLLGQTPLGGWWAASLVELRDFLEYCESKPRFDPLGLDELAELSGLEPAEARVLAERVVAKRLSVPEKRSGARKLKTPMQRYLELKQRFEIAPWAVVRGE